MKRKFLVSCICSLICLALLTGSALAQTTPTEWVARYAYSWDDGAEAIAVDGLGNVFVTGSSGVEYSPYLYVTIKYDTNGNQLWMASYLGPGGEGRSEAKAIAVDTAGNVYVTGHSDGSPGGTAYATIKYDTNGTELWVARYNGPGNQNDRASALAVDGTGNVYVTGFSSKDVNTCDYATIKYDTNGNQLWAARYNGSGGGEDRATALAMDGAGNIYVTGYSDQGDENDDYATVKYDTNGSQLWVARYNGPGGGADRATALAVDGAGNVHVTGYSPGGDISDIFDDYATLKYDTNGNQLWVARYNGPSDQTDRAAALALDSQGNVHVTGYSHHFAGYNPDYVTIKYDPDGEELWMARYNGPDGSSDRAAAIAVDSPGNVYVTGHSYGVNESNDYTTVMYDPQGQQLCVERYNGPSSRSDVATAIALAGTGNVIVTGFSSQGSDYFGDDFDFATVKYDLLNPATVVCSLDCTPSSGTVPFDTSMSVMMWHNHVHQGRRIAARIDLVTGAGNAFSNWRAGYAYVAGGTVFNVALQTTIPELPWAHGNNVFSMVAEDVTPPPYNQPPYPAAGESNTSSCTVTAFAR